MRDSGAARFDLSGPAYDAWYDTPKGRVLLASEVACLKPLLQRFPRPYLEVGVGTGRFAEALGIEYGVDPAPRALAWALQRGVKALLGVGAALPFRDASFGAVLLAFTFCFVQDPRRVMREIHRVLFPEGGLVLGLLLQGTPWADLYAKRGREGDPLFKTAHFFSREEVEKLLEENRFGVTGIRSTLFQPPELETYREEEPLDAYASGAGFVAIAAVKTPLTPACAAPKESGVLRTGAAGRQFLSPHLTQRVPGTRGRAGEGDLHDRRVGDSGGGTGFVASVSTELDEVSAERRGSWRHEIKTSRDHERTT